MPAFILFPARCRQRYHVLYVVSMWPARRRRYYKFMCIFVTFCGYIYINFNPLKILDELLGFVGMIKIMIKKMIHIRSCQDRRCADYR